MIYFFCKNLAKLIFKLFFGIEYIGRENIPRQGGFILAGNHASYMDPVAVGTGCRQQVNFMAKAELFGVPVLGWLISRVRAFPVKRNGSDIRAFKESIRRVGRGEGLVLFPEGTRQAGGGKLGKPEPGVGLLVSKLTVPVIPVFIQGTDKAWPKEGKGIRLFTKIRIYYGKPVEFRQGSSYEDIAEDIMAGIRKLAQQAVV